MPVHRVSMGSRADSARVAELGAEAVLYHAKCECGWVSEETGDGHLVYVWALDHAALNWRA